MDQKLTVQVEAEPPFVIVSMTGVVGDADVHKITTTLEELRGGDAKYLLVDLGGVSAVDSAGLGILAQAQSFCQGCGLGYAVVQSPSTQVRRVCEITGLGKVVPIYDTRQAAFEALVREKDSGDRQGVS
jgi:anti-anti-sigma factor